MNVSIWSVPISGCFVANISINPALSSSKFGSILPKSLNIVGSETCELVGKIASQGA